MTIVCGVDSSAPSRQALLAAAAIGARTGERLLIVSVADRPSVFDPVGEQALSRARLSAAVTFAGELGCTAEGVLRHGDPAEELRAVCARADAWLLVIGHERDEGEGGARIGRVATRLFRRAPCPWLVVTTADPWVAWTRGARSLRVSVGADLTPASSDALGFVRKLRTVGPVDARAVHVAWPPEAHHHVAAHGSMPLDELRPDVAEALEEELRRHACVAFDEPHPAVEVAHAFGRPEHELVGLADAFGADVLVVGRRQKSWRQRFSSPAVAEGALRLAPMSTLVVPSRAMSDLRAAEAS